MPNGIKWIGRLLVALVALPLIGCAYHGDGEGNPIARKFVWFSFVGGDDIKASCGPNSPDRYRLVYNGVWKQQVRIYELGDGMLRHLKERVLGAGTLVSVSLDDPLSSWSGTAGEADLSEEQYQRLVESFVQSGAFAPPEVGLRLASDRFYWTAAACYHGHFFFNAWLYPSTRFEQATFPGQLLALDKTGVDLNPPRALYPSEVAVSEQAAAQERWYIEVGRTGMQ